MKLIIVESPTKARTLQGFLGTSYKVVSSKGHVIDLPPKSLGVDVANNFTPEYVILKPDIAKALKQASTDAKLILLATDPDREGEAIAYHIQSLIKKPAKRVLFYEITKEAIQEAIKNPGTIDVAKIEAQQSRRILDRLVGYEVSPLLWKTFNNYKLSAGRVQSVALRLICEREAEIRDFKPEEFWEIKCKLQPVHRDTCLPFLAKLIKIKISNAKEAKKVEQELKDAKFIVNSFKKEEKGKNPYPPYITSTLQQDASVRLRLSTKRTMRIAQQLFEGIKLEKKSSVGLITYMRTDSLRIADKAIFEARKYIEKELGKNYLSLKPRRYKGKVSMGAHEAIRPTSVKRAPELIRKSLTPEQFKLYSLIWQRFLASQMAQTKYEIKTMDITADKYWLRAESNTLKFPGFTKVYKIEVKKETVIPELLKGDKLTLIKVLKEQKFTKPKPRYTEGTMVRKLDAEGIGRPSTYAPIISRIIEKEYVKKEDRKLIPTELGETVNKILVSRFSDIFNVNFTRKMEESLDKVESKETTRTAVLKAFYKPFEKDVTEFVREKKNIKEEITEPTDKICELCGKPMVIKWGKYGKFLACSGFPKCKNTKPLESTKLEATCPKCGAPLVIKEGKYGRFLACSNYPKCTFTKTFTLDVKCPECGKELAERRTKKGRIFYGCTNYPKCKFATWYKPVAQKCEFCSYPILIEKKGKLECPKCKKTVRKLR
ncbi:type I DNA topoisomerase [candidate division WOR-3 bacterium]|nr:type I DNA topoisomerase [candidate division WOR-3 bacterium]